MQSFKTGTEEIKYEVQYCTLVKIETNSETHISGSGGGGSSYNGTGAVRGISITSHVITTQKLYVRDADDNQAVIELTNWNFSGMEGHELVLIYAVSNWFQGYAVVYNRTIDRVWHSRFNQFFKPIYEGNGKVLLIFCGLATFVIPPMIAGSGFRGSMDGIAWVVFFIIASICAGICLRFFSKQNEIKSYYPQMKSRLEKILKENL